ncbi:MAG: hypothetical protein ACERKN_14040 [Velocimicrobium sp.]
MKKNAYNINEDEDYLVSASCNDCTGLIPSAVQSEDEMENYQNICKFSPTQINQSITPNKKKVT